MKYEIKHRYSGDTLYTAEIPDDTASGMHARVALEKAGPVAEHILNACRVSQNGCIEWMLSTDRGRGRITINGKRQYAHRALWEALGGEIPSGMFLCHGCDNPLCVNPEHMFIGTHQQNMADMVEKGRSTKGRPLTLAHRLRLSIAGRGRRLSEETRRAIAAGVAATRASMKLSPAVPGGEKPAE